MGEIGTSVEEEEEEEEEEGISCFSHLFIYLQFLYNPRKVCRKVLLDCIG